MLSVAMVMVMDDTAALGLESESESSGMVVMAEHFFRIGFSDSVYWPWRWRFYRHRL